MKSVHHHVAPIAGRVVDIGVDARDLVEDIVGEIDVSSIVDGVSDRVDRLTDLAGDGLGVAGTRSRRVTRTVVRTARTHPRASIGAGALVVLLVAGWFVLRRRSTDDAERSSHLAAAA
jgi:hypothetical protein